MTQKALNAVHQRLLELHKALADIDYELSTLSHGEDGLDNAAERSRLLRQRDHLQALIDIYLHGD